MNLNEINLIIMYIFLLLLTVLVNPINMLNVFILIELLWISLYILTVLLSYFYDDLILLSLSFFFLLLSATELIVGFILILFQHTLLHDSKIDFDTYNTSKLSLRYSNNVYLNRLI